MAKEKATSSPKEQFEEEEVEKDNRTEAQKAFDKIQERRVRKIIEARLGIQIKFCFVSLWDSVISNYSFSLCISSKGSRKNS